MRFSTLLAVVALGTAVAGCVSTEDDVPDQSGQGTVSFAQVVGPILTANCSGCHGYMSSRASLLAQGSVPGYNTPPVVPSNSAGSPIYDKVRLDKAPSHGARMPQGGALSQNQVTAIKTWIDEGALNN